MALSSLIPLYCFRDLASAGPVPLGPRWGRTHRVWSVSALMTCFPSELWVQAPSSLPPLGGPGSPSLRLLSTQSQSDGGSGIAADLSGPCSVTWALSTPRQGFLECGPYTTSGTHNDSRRPLGVLFLKLIVMAMFDVY